MKATACSLCALLLGVLCLAGCGEAVQDIDDTAGVLTGATQLKVGREVEQEARRIVNDHRDALDDVMANARGDDDDEDEDEDYDE